MIAIWAFCALNAPGLPYVGEALRTNDQSLYRAVMEASAVTGCRDARFPEGPTPQPFEAVDEIAIDIIRTTDGECLVRHQVKVMGFEESKIVILPASSPEICGEDI